MAQQDTNHPPFEQRTTISSVHPLLETERLIQRRFSLEDAPFILELLNDPGWVQFIGDFGVRTLDDARSYIETRPLAMYNRVGFGLYLVALKEGNVPIGMCGLIKRDTLEDVDIGFAFLPTFRGKGYAYEAASAMLEYGKQEFALKRIVAITTPDNVSSARLLEKLGLRFERMIIFPPENEELKLFAVEF
ncbi:alanine acetyltransferase [Ktedonobacter sp. SOSP1-52]|uniref:GNAT family N-acetyltransferase n=1 Tax=Ktedonobacter sp. SOSP1-52 TaxID=2778366 RepID=UPI001916A4F1|nr:GNAT family N-acetyltransferase [Ktedonobacter sp. SOSP1-52]GHO71834.1 alanine acetyltransferase [Ktedonobacter sp. SOSP1-52]